MQLFLIFLRIILIYAIIFTIGIGIYMSFSKNKIDKSLPIAIDKDDDQLIYYNNTTGTEKVISKKGFEPFYYGDAVVYVSGRRGAGKSTFCNIYIHNYVKATDGRVFLISRLKEDESIKLPERGMRIPINEISQITMDDLKDSLIVFDDINDANLNKYETAILNKFIIDVIENSRHYNLSVIITSHMMANFKQTRPFLYESSAVVIYPQWSNLAQIEKVMRSYYSMSTTQIKDIFNSPSRWVYVNTITPKYIMTQHEIYTYKYQNSMSKSFKTKD